MYQYHRGWSMTFSKIAKITQKSKILANLSKNDIFAKIGIFRKKCKKTNKLQNRWIFRKTANIIGAEVHLFYAGLKIWPGAKFEKTQVFSNLGPIEISIAAAALFSASAGPVASGQGGLLRTLVLGGSISGSLLAVRAPRCVKNFFFFKIFFNFFWKFPDFRSELGHVFLYFSPVHMGT